MPAFKSFPERPDISPANVGPAEQPRSPARASKANIAVPPPRMRAEARLNVPGQKIPTAKPQTVLFREDTGVTLYDYIMQEKLDLAKNLLTFTDYSYSDISSYLGFSSQSHLGKVFKNATGLTLMQYRNKYRE